MSLLILLGPQFSREHISPMVWYDGLIEGDLLSMLFSLAIDVLECSRCIVLRVGPWEGGVKSLPPHLF